MSSVLQLRLTPARIVQAEVKRDNYKILLGLYEDGKKKKHPGDDNQKKKWESAGIETVVYIDSARQPRAI